MTLAINNRGEAWLRCGVCHEDFGRGTVVQCISAAHVYGMRALEPLGYGSGASDFARAEIRCARCLAMLGGENGLTAVEVTSAHARPTMGANAWVEHDMLVMVNTERGQAREVMQVLGHPRWSCGMWVVTVHEPDSPITRDHARMFHTVSLDRVRILDAIEAAGNPRWLYPGAVVQAHGPHIGEAWQDAVVQAWPEVDAGRRWSVKVTVSGHEKQPLVCNVRELKPREESGTGTTDVIDCGCAYFIPVRGGSYPLSLCDVHKSESSSEAP